MNDKVNSPEHYTQGDVECIDAIKASLGNEDFASYCKGNVMKYIWRYRHKDGVQDLEKALVYLTWMIKAETTLQYKDFKNYPTTEGEERKLTIAKAISSISKSPEFRKAKSIEEDVRE